MKAVLHRTSSAVQSRVLYSVSRGPAVRGFTEDGEGISVKYEVLVHPGQGSSRAYTMSDPESIKGPKDENCI